MTATAPQTSPVHTTLADYAAPTYTLHAGDFATRTERATGLSADDVVTATVALTGQPAERVAAFLLYRRYADERTLRIPAAPTDGAEACYITRDELDVATVREDVAKLIEGHEGVGASRTIPRGHNGAADIEVFDLDGQQIAFVTIYADGNVEVLPVVQAEIVSGDDGPEGYCAHGVPEAQRCGQPDCAGAERTGYDSMTALERDAVQRTG
jgi:hypothetical protein